MCGIVGFLGSSKPACFLIDKLSKLEYRGYDSAGVANFSDGEINIIKAVGNIENLRQKLDENQMVNCAIAHTRWATHGVPSEVNAHPHSSSTNEWTIVHNGIIENYQELKQELQMLGCKF